ncbi:Na+/H+ antiporter subunit E [Ferrimonas balearica]|uniref:Na+/H+ antiporter subunit E n=1 Tax=Ferrimonas balearica TaxID=44012 RepID=UPI001C99FEA6|nr:Na+/H+ antiporter subunit E [Ferrimonas balearica]MBY5991202.1 Na+/H+ antiporter subunit E [Ferrimonas balearica]
MSRALGLALVLALLWISNSGHFSALMLSFGLGSLVLVMWLSRHMDFLQRRSPLKIHRLPGYFLWLLGQVVIANLQVARRVIAGPKSLSPALGKLPMSQQGELGRVIYANSITLTPGTISVALVDGSVRVHALHQSGLESLAEGEMDRRVTALES